MHLWGDRLPGGEMVSHMVESGRKHAQANGMHPYYLYRQKHQAGNLENVGYALKDHACLYNIDMMEDVCSVLALGAGAISKRVWPGREKIVRSPNVKQVQDYIVRAGEMARRKEALWEI
jgi:oxygen-independent coproporphyrinogen-3 oxidase